jgi:hypothetical protein
MLTSAVRASFGVFAADLPDGHVRVCFVKRARRKRRGYTAVRQSGHFPYGGDRIRTHVVVDQPPDVDPISLVEGRHGPRGRFFSFFFSVSVSFARLYATGY